MMVRGQQIAVGIHGIGASCGADGLQAVDHDRFVFGLGLEGTAFVG